MKRLVLACLAAVTALGVSPDSATGQSDAPAPPMVEQYLSSGKLADGQRDLEARLDADPGDDQARFSLGVVRFLRGVENLSGALSRYGLSHRAGQSMGLPILRLPVPANADPDEIDYDAFRGIIQQWVEDLAATEQTLAEIKGDDVKLPLRFGNIRLDLNGDGEATDEEALWRIYAALNPGVVRGTDEEFRQQAESFIIAFDTADVYWLRGYCHLLAAVGKVYLAHDSEELFKRTAHLFFPRVDSPYPFLSQKAETNGFDVDMILDAIAMVHLIRLPVKDANKLTAALEDLEAVVALSRASWDSILAEEDDDREWIPSPTQAGVIPNVEVTQAMVDGWQEFLDEFEDLLAGKRLMPFWRGEENLGVNLRRVFTEPTTLDLILWVQGSAAAPYLEQGPLVDEDLWWRLNDVFRGQFIGFAIWFN